MATGMTVLFVMYYFIKKNIHFSFVYHRRLVVNHLTKVQAWNLITAMYSAWPEAQFQCHPPLLHILSP